MRTISWGGSAANPWLLLYLIGFIYTFDKRFNATCCIKNFKIATSYKFEGYKISKYFGITSGSTVLGTGFLSEVRAAVSDTLGIEADSFSDKLEQAKNSSVHKMINNAIQQGGNALIGVSFDYFTVASNMIGVVANGTVVEIEVSNGQIDND